MRTRNRTREVESCINSRHFEKAADVGYGSISAGFVFLQRTLGGLHERCMDKTRIVQEIAATLGCPYEEALPHVDAVMKSAVQREQITAFRAGRVEGPGARRDVQRQDESEHEEL